MYCDQDTFTCGSYNSQNCTYGCTNTYCNNQPVTPIFTNTSSPLNIIGEIKSGVFGFLSFTGMPMFNLIFIIIVVMIIVGFFSLAVHIIKKGYH